MSSRDQTEGTEHAVELPQGTDEALETLSEAAEAWGAEWRREGSGGRLVLPVTAGLRHGRLTGHISTEPARLGPGTRLRFLINDIHYQLHWQAVVILAFGALGGISFTLWPFYPALLAFAPIALVLAFAAWFLVASRLRTAGVEEFFELLKASLSPPCGSNTSPKKTPKATSPRSTARSAAAAARSTTSSRPTP